jgi:predicted nucleic-acid-binding protein
MKRIDANIILRILLKDNKEMFEKARQIIKESYVFVSNEIIAEVVYVLLGVYKSSRFDICNSLIKFINVENIEVENKAVIEHALKIFLEQNFDFVDALLVSYYYEGDEIFTFDKKINKLLL